MFLTSLGEMVFPDLPVKFKRIYSAFEHRLLLVQVIHFPPTQSRLSSRFHSRLLKFMSERLHLTLSAFPGLQKSSQSIWNTFLSLFHLALYRNVSPELVLLGSQLSLDSNAPTFARPAQKTLPPKSKSVNKSDFPKSFTQSQSLAAKFSEISHPNLSMDHLLLASIVHSSDSPGAPAEAIFKFYKSSVLHPCVDSFEDFSSWFTNLFCKCLPLTPPPSLKVFFSSHTQFLSKKSVEVRKFKRYSTEFNKSLLTSRKVLVTSLPSPASSAPSRKSRSHQRSPFPSSTCRGPRPPFRCRAAAPPGPNR